MENYFAMNLEKKDIDAISNLGLAHMGDCVWEILVRSSLCAGGEKTVGGLHKKTFSMVNAPYQAKCVEKLLPLLNEEELSYYRRGKNAHVHAVPQGGYPCSVCQGHRPGGPVWLSLALRPDGADQ